MKRRKILTLTTTLIVTTLLSSTTVFAEASRGKMISGRTMIPLRGAFQDLGFDVDWDSSTNTATLKDDDHVIQVQKDNYEFTVDGVTYTSDVAPTLINGSIYIPLRSIGDTIGATSLWKENIKVASLTYDGNTANIFLGAPPTLPTPTKAQKEVLIDFLVDEQDYLERYQDGIDTIQGSTGNSWARNEFDMVIDSYYFLNKQDFSALTPEQESNIKTFAACMGNAGQAYTNVLDAMYSGNKEVAAQQKQIANMYFDVAYIYYSELFKSVYGHPPAPLGFEGEYDYF